MRIVLFTLLLASCAPAVANTCNLSVKQYEVLDYSFYEGRKYNLGYTLAAIAMHESNLGDWVVNLNDPSAGDYHVTLDKVLRYKGWADTAFNRNRAASELIHNKQLSANLAINELLYWQRRLKDWDSAVRAYNAGNNWRSSRGTKYLTAIETNIRKIKECQWLRY